MSIDQQVRAWFAAGPSGPPLALHPDDEPHAREVLATCLAELAERRGILAPHQLRVAYATGTLTAEQLKAAWIACEWPCRALPASEWVSLFRALVPAPSLGPIEVWRSQVGPDVGLSWTTDRDTALWFHRRDRGVLLHGTTSQLLAVIDGPEHEILIDPCVQFGNRNALLFGS